MAENSFWCCACTGMESFAKLPQNIYYTAEGTVKVNMFYPTQFKVSDSVTLVQSGNFYTDQRTVLTVNGAGSFTLSIRIPDWAKKGYTLKVNGEEVTAQKMLADTDMTVKAIAATLHYDYYYFIRLFRKKTGMTPHQFRSAIVPDCTVFVKEDKKK